MRLKLKKKETDLIDTDDLSVQLEDSDKKKDFFQLSIRALLQFIKDFSLDLAEIKSDEFRNDISRLSEKFSNEKKTDKRVGSSTCLSKQAVHSHGNYDSQRRRISFLR